MKSVLLCMSMPHAASEMALAFGAVETDLADTAGMGCRNNANMVQRVQ